MTNDKRGRGRPKGTGKRDDAILHAVADLMAANPGMKATTARRRIEPMPNDADIRRFQVKWQAGKDGLLAAARARRERPLRSIGQNTVAPATKRALADIASTIQAAIHGASGGSSLRAAIEGYTSAAQLASRVARESSAVRLAREYNNLASVKIMRELQDSPTMKAALAMQESPMMEAARGLQDSPVMKAARGIQTDMMPNVTRALAEHARMQQSIVDMVNGGRIGGV
jgi:hypothetical protein